MNLSRMEPLVGAAGAEKLRASRVMVVGLGGVGGYCVEALARAGVGTLILVDGDRVDSSNVNRQILAMSDTFGRYKADVAVERVVSVNPDAQAVGIRLFVDANTVDRLPFESCDAVVDCVDTVAAKVVIASAANHAGILAVSCMGSGNKLHARFEVADLYETSVCPLARAMRGLAKKAGIERLAVVYSKDKPDVVSGNTPASISYVPAQAGLRCAEYVIEKLLESI